MEAALCHSSRKALARGQAAGDNDVKGLMHCIALVWHVIELGVLKVQASVFMIPFSPLSWPIQKPANKQARPIFLMRHLGGRRQCDNVAENALHAAGSHASDNQLFLWMEVIRRSIHLPWQDDSMAMRSTQGTRVAITRLEAGQSVLLLNSTRLKSE